MSSTCETAGLTKGLRALEVLAAAAPVDPSGFAQAVGVGLVEAMALLEAFDTLGYVRRVPGGAFFVLTRLALGLVESPSPAGRLVSQSIEPIVEFGDRTGHIVALSIPSGRDLMCCVVSRCTTAAGLSPGLRRSWPDSTGTRSGEELAVVLRLDREPIGLLSVHCGKNAMLGHEVALRRLLGSLGERLVRDLRPSTLAVNDVALRAPLFASAMVH